MRQGIELLAKTLLVRVVENSEMYECPRRTSGLAVTRDLEEVLDVGSFWSLHDPEREVHFINMGPRKRTH